MRSHPLLNRAYRYVSEGPAGLPKPLLMEWRFVVVRWLAILFVAPGLVVAGLPHNAEMGAYGVLSFAAVYNVVVQLTILKYPRAYATGYLTTVMDGLLNIIMISVAGGFNSPIYYIAFTVTIAAAMRYGYGPAVAMASTFMVFDIMEQFRTVGVITSPFYFRTGFLLVTAILAGYLQEQTRRAQGALRHRLDQANLLNESTAKLGADLELEPVLAAVCEAAAHLFGASQAVLLPDARLSEDGPNPLGPICFPRSARSEDNEALVALCTQHANTDNGDDGGQAIKQASLSTGQEAMVVALMSPNTRVRRAVLAVAMAPGQPIPERDQDVVASFGERIALAIENSSLYRTIASRSSALMRAYADLAKAHEELLKADELKSDFIANVSHEFRTPLSSIRAFSEMLLLYENPPDVTKEFLQIIVSESERLTRLVNDVLDLAKIDSGNVDWQAETIDVGTLLRETGRTYVPLMEKQGINFEQDIAKDIPAIVGDRDRIQQVVHNLLDNAIKFTEAGTIRLEAQLVGDEILVSVKDTGIGIAEEDQERIFDKFQQVGEVLTDKPKGTGLGLAICKEIVQHHSGRLWVESEPKKGSAFKFSLKPAVDAEESPIVESPSELSSSPSWIAQGTAAAAA